MICYRDKIPSYCLTALETLSSAGFECYVVGGAVRDLVMGLTPSDYDITTSAFPDETIEVMNAHGIRYLPTGLKHGTVMALIDGETVEITTYRIDGDYSDSRHPDSVTFTRDIRGDVARRDFTMNAMYLDKDGFVRDEVGGLDDIRDGIIRAVGQPGLRFREDALRIMRGLRFAASTGFDIESGTFEAMLENALLLHNIAGERIAHELNGLLVAADAPKILSVSSVILREIIPFIDVSLSAPVIATLPVIDGKRDLSLTLAALLLPGGVTGAGTVLGDLRYANEIRDKVIMLISEADRPLPSGRPAIHRMMARLGPSDALDAVTFITAVHGENDHTRDVADTMAALIDEGAVFSVTDLKIGGGDVLELGVPAGPEVGRLLGRIFEMYMDGEVPNEREPLLRLLMAIL